MTLQAVPPKDRELTKEDLDRSVEIMRDRVDRLGVAEPTITTQGDDQIAIQLPGIKDPAAAAAIIGKTAKLELFDLEVNLVPPSIDGAALPGREGVDLRPPGRPAGTGGRGDLGRVVPLRQEKKLVAGPVADREAALRKFDGELPDGYKLFGVPPKTVVVSCAPGDICPTRAVARSPRSASGTCCGTRRRTCRR